MSFGIIVAIATAASIVVAVVLRLAPSEMQRWARKALRAAPAMLTAPADGATVRALGTVVADGPVLTSPIHGVKCVAFHVEAIARAGRVPSGTYREYARCVTFILDCGELGSFVVDDERAPLAFAPRRAGRWDITTRREVLRELRLDSSNALRSELSEVVVPVGASVAVAGRVAVFAPVGGGHAEAVPIGRLHPIAIGPADR
jgi:hypothetical protein